MGVAQAQNLNQLALGVSQRTGITQNKIDFRLLTALSKYGVLTESNNGFTITVGNKSEFFRFLEDPDAAGAKKSSFSYDTGHNIGSIIQGHLYGKSEISVHLAGLNAGDKVIREALEYLERQDIKVNLHTGSLGNGKFDCIIMLGMSEVPLAPKIVQVAGSNLNMGGIIIEDTKSTGHTPDVALHMKDGYGKLIAVQHGNIWDEK